eukprot:SAG22_NODE_484_length_9912_cov_23.425150_1_plen_218_part_00
MHGLRASCITCPPLSIIDAFELGDLRRQSGDLRLGTPGGQASSAAPDFRRQRRYPSPVQIGIIPMVDSVAREVSDLQSYPTMGGVWGFLYLSELTSGQRCPRILQFSHVASMGNTEQQQRARVRPHTGGSGALSPRSCFILPQRELAAGAQGIGRWYQSDGLAALRLSLMVGQRPPRAPDQTIRRVSRQLLAHNLTFSLGRKAADYAVYTALSEPLT